MSMTEVQRAVEQTLAGTASNTTIECDACGMSSDEVGTDRLVEHALFDHVTRAGLIAVRRSVLLSAYEMAAGAGLAPVTDHESQWRQQRQK